MVLSPSAELSPASPLAGPNQAPAGDTTTAYVADDAVLKAGWLSKRGGHTMARKRRWFVLRREGLAYYKDQREYESRKVVRIEDISGITSKSSGKRTAVCFYVGSRQVHVLAETEEVAASWVQALKAAVKMDQSQSSVPTSPIDIVGVGAHRSFLPAGSLPQASLVSSFGMPQSTSMRFSDDELSPALQSDDDFSPPFSTVTSQHEDDRDVIPAAFLTRRAERDKVIIQGYLRKHQSGPLRGSATVWAVLRPYGMYLYPDDNEYSPLKIIPFADIIDASDLPTEAELSGSLQKTRKKARFRFQVITKKKALRFSVDEEKALDDWLGGIKSCLEKRDMLVADPTSPTTKTVGFSDDEGRRHDNNVIT